MSCAYGGAPVGFPAGELPLAFPGPRHDEFAEMLTVSGGIIVVKHDDVFESFVVG